MYERFFGLRERPFDLVPDLRYLFLSGPQREALSTLRYALEAARGLSLLIGEAGAGKSTLVQAALAEIGPGKTQCVLLSNPTLTRDEFFEFLAEAFGLGAQEAASKTRFLSSFRRHLEERHLRGQLTALIIDEAQSLPYELLEEVRLLSNIETPTSKLLSVILTGQPELSQRLNEPQLRQLKQRIALRCELAVLGLPETAAYVAGRIRIAGGTPADVFTREAVEAVFQASGGVPRLVNVICDNALIGGFAAQTKPVTRAVVDEVLRDFDLAGATADFQSEARGAGRPPRPLPAPGRVPARRDGPSGDDERPPGPALFARFGGR